MQDGTGTAVADKPVQTTDQSQVDTPSQEEQFIPTSRIKPAATNGNGTTNNATDNKPVVDATNHPENTATQKKEGEGQEGQQPAAGQNQPAPEPEISNEKLLEELSKRTGTKVDSLETAKTKLAYQIPSKEPSKEEKAKQEKAHEDKLLDLHIKRGGTAAQFAAFQQLANGDLKEISINQTRSELKTEGFTESQIDEIIKERYYQLDDTDIEAQTDEEKKKELQKLKNFGTKKLTSRGTPIIQTAKGYFDSLEKELQQIHAKDELSTKHVSQVEAAINGIQREETIDLGEINKEKVAPIKLKVSEEAIQKAKELIKDPETFESQFLTQDGELNVDAILPKLVKALAYEDAVNGAYREGINRTVEHYTSIFGPIPPGLGGAQKVSQDESTKAIRKGKIAPVPAVQ